MEYLTFLLRKAIQSLFTWAAVFLWPFRIIIHFTGLYSLLYQRKNVIFTFIPHTASALMESYLYKVNVGSNDNAALFPCVRNAPMRNA